MLPNRVAQATTRSETDVYRLIKEAAGSEEYMCLHSLGIARHERKEYSEADFVVIGPAGVFCLEVKGGEVKRTQGVWEIGWPGSSYSSVEGPFKQAQAGRWPLGREIESRVGIDLRRTGLLGWGVIFPDIVFRHEDPEWDLDVVYDQRDKDQSFIRYIERLEAYFTHRMLETGKSAPSKLGPARIQAIVECLRGDFDLVPSIAGLIGDSKRELLSLSSDQYRALDYALHPANARVLCDGAAGTGKTLIAREAAARLAGEGLRVLLVCFNRNLASFLKSELSNLDSRVQVDTAYGILREIIIKGGQKGSLLHAEVNADPEELFFSIYPRLFEDAATSLLETGELPQFDALVIDEGQDILSASVLDCLDLLLDAGFQGGRWTILLDSQIQSDVYGRMEISVKENLTSLGAFVILLGENFRNPRGIVSEMCRITDLPTPICRRNLASTVDYRVASDAAEVARKLKALILELMQARVPISDISVLSANAREKSCLEKSKLEIGKPIRWLEDRVQSSQTGDALTASTISGFKGLENEIVILTDLPDGSFLSSWERSLIYVGMTRARTKLFAIVTPSFIEMRENIWLGEKGG